MPKHFSVATIIEKNKIASDVAFLVALEVDVRDPLTGDFIETLYLVKNSEDITYQGNLYKAMDFDLDIKEEAGSVPKMEVAIRDYSKAVQAEMQNYGGGVGFDLRMLVINSGNLSQSPEVIEHFKITTANAANYVVNWGIGAENPLTIRFPRRRQFRDRCSWRYKSEECGYTGGLPSCDLSLQGSNGCAAHGNEGNYGGFPGINQRGR